MPLGGAVFVKWGRLDVDGCKFYDCNTNSIYDKTGGGGLWTTAKELTVKNSEFHNCACPEYYKGTKPGKGQAGAIFHNINADDAGIT